MEDLSPEVTHSRDLCTSLISSQSSGAQPSLICAHKDTSDLAKCHKIFSKHNTDILKHRNIGLFLLFVFVWDYDKIYVFKAIISKGHTIYRPRKPREGTDQQFYSSINLSAGWRWVVKATLRLILPSERDVVPSAQGTGWAPGTVCPHMHSIPGPSRA